MINYAIGGCPYSRAAVLTLLLGMTAAGTHGETMSTSEPNLSRTPAPSGPLVYIGTYTDKGSKGIYAYRLDSATGKLASLGVAAETPNPTFLAIHPNHRFL